MKLALSWIVAALAALGVSAQLENLRGAMPRFEQGSCTYANIMSSCGGSQITFTNSTSFSFESYCNVFQCEPVCNDQLPQLRIDDCLDLTFVNIISEVGASGAEAISQCMDQVCCSCFSGDCTVDVQGQMDPVLMKDLQVGDKVLTDDNKYEPVYAFAHKDDESLGSYLSISTSNKDHSIEISKNHLIYLKGQNQPVTARQVVVGDEVLIKDGESAVVTDIKIISKPGLYGPLTPGGNIMVNGIKASNYVGLHELAPQYVSVFEAFGFSHHTMNHLWFSPLRLACMAVSDKTCETYTEGFHTWSASGRNVVAFTDSFPLILRPIGMGAVIGFVLTSITVEYFINTPALLAAAAALVMAVKYGKKQKKEKIV